MTTPTKKKDNRTCKLRGGRRETKAMMKKERSEADYNSGEWDVSISKKESVRQDCV